MAVDLDAWSDHLVAMAKPLIRRALLDLVGDRPPTEIAALGLYTDSDARSVVAAVCTDAHLQQLVARQPQYAAYYLWATNEWDLNAVERIEAGGPDVLGPLCAELDRTIDRVARGEAGGDGMHQYLYIACSALVDAMGELFAEGFFDPYVDAVQVFEAVDAGVDDQTQREWMAVINTDAASAAFAQRLADARR